MADWTVDIAVIGAGIAGASAAYELAASASVILIEREDRPGYHSTGRSAALYTETYGEAVIRALTIASRNFLESPPPDFCETSLLTPRGVLWVGRADQSDLIDQVHADAKKLVPEVQVLSGAQARELCPALRRDYVAGGVWEPDAMDIDVHALHHAFLKGFARRGGCLLTNSEATSLVHRGERWSIRAGEQTISAQLVVDAAGAWADAVATMAGVAPVNLVPARRTALTFDPPPAAHIARWPCVLDVAEEFYFKPEAGRLLGSLADETPVPPCDVQPEELDVAIAVDRIEQATDITIRRVHSKWAGLRCFVADRCPALGRDSGQPAFYWLAGQGGYGIMTAPAAARALSSLILQDRLPSDLESLGATRESLSPDRLRC